MPLDILICAILMPEFDWLTGESCYGQFVPPSREGTIAFLAYAYCITTSSKYDVLIPFSTIAQSPSFSASVGTRVRWVNDIVNSTQAVISYDATLPSLLYSTVNSTQACGTLKL